MADGGATFALAAASLLSTAATINNANEQRSSMRKAQQAQEDARKRAEAGMAVKDAEEKQLAERDKARQRQKVLAATSQGKNSTILTSPLGVVGNEGQQKTLLGQ